MQSAPDGRKRICQRRAYLTVHLVEVGDGGVVAIGAPAPFERRLALDDQGFERGEGHLDTNLWRPSLVVACDVQDDPTAGDFADTMLEPADELVDFGLEQWRRLQTSKSDLRGDQWHADSDCSRRASLRCGGKLRESQAEGLPLARGMGKNSRPLRNPYASVRGFRPEAATDRRVHQAPDLLTART